MAITFNCEHCGKSLTTSDDKAGRKAKCPGCSEMITVPSTDVAAADGDIEEGDLADLPAAPSPSRKSSSSAPAGPKTCPMCGAENPPRAKSCQACGEEFEVDEPTKHQGRGSFDVGEVLSTSWVIYKNQLGLVLGSVLIAGIISSFASAPAQILSTINDVQRQQGQNPDVALQAVSFLLLIPSYLVSWFLQIGVTQVLFKVARGKETNLGEIFSGGRYFLRMLGATLLFVILAGLGFVACVVPGVLVTLMFWPYVYVLIDENPEGISCLWRSKEITQGTWGSVFVLMLAAMGVSLLGFVMCCVGAIFTVPLAQLFLAVAYCRITGQRTAE